MLQQDQELMALIIAGTIMLLMLGIFIIGFLFFYQKKHNTHLSEKDNLRSEFKQELLKTRIEIQEETLTHISREIHDNVSQVLSFVKLNLAMADDTNENNKQKIIESRNLIAQAIVDLRNLSKSLSFEQIALFGLVKTIEIETERINNSGLIKAEIKIAGSPYSLGEQRELVLFRIYQEALNNVLKHANAKHLKIRLQYSELLFNLTLEDDGDGFSRGLMANSSGSGLKNMENRATLIGAVSIIDSTPGKGCSVMVSLNPFEQQLYTDGSHTDRPGR
jgi:signal transduction histidine kinase